MVGEQFHNRLISYETWYVYVHRILSFLFFTSGTITLQFTKQTLFEVWECVSCQYKQDCGREERHLQQR